jgi:hypothetical protein
MMRNAIAASVVALCLCAGIAIAQSSKGEVNGAVTDVAGGVIHGARVTLKKGRDTRTAQTDANGQYAFKNLPRGIYIARFELEGFLPTNAKVSVGDKPVRVDAVLRVNPEFMESGSRARDLCRCDYRATTSIRIALVWAVQREQDAYGGFLALYNAT